jgi:PAS domain S-box-containing protein
MDKVSFQREATRTQANGIVMWFAIIPAVAFVDLAAVLPLVDAGPSHDSPTLLFLLNAVFLALFPLLASGLAARAFIASGSTSVLLLGCGLLTMSWASLLAGWVSSLPDGANDTVTVHDLCFMLSGVFLLAGSLIGTSTRGKHRILPERPEARLLAAYGMVIVLVTAVTAGAVKDLFPVFFVQGEGPTLLRQLVLAAAMTLFSFSSFIYAHLFFRTKASFLWWYFLALLLIAQGLGIVLFQKAMGTPINWAGRGFQYLGGVYLFVAVWECLKEARSKRTSFEKVLTALVDVGDLNRAQEALRESKARFSTFFHASPMSVAITRLADNQFVDVNESWQNLTGFTREEVIGRTPLELNIWVDFGERDRLIRRLREQGIVRGFEIQIRQKSGNIRHLIMAAEMIELAGEPLMLSMAVDITDRKQVEEELRRGEERLRLTLEATNDGIWDWNIPTGNAIFSQRWYTMLGYEPYEFPQSYDSWRGLVHPDDVDRGQREIRKHISSGEGYSVELRMKTKSGGWQWIQTRGRVVEWAADGHAVRLVGTHSDITERKLAEETIREAESKYRSIFENSREGIYQSTPEGRYLTVNPAMARIYGYSSPEEMVSSITSIDREIFVIPENRDELKQLVPTEGAVKDFQVEQRRKDGSIFWASLNVHAVYGDDGSIRYWEGRSIDITARVQQDREIKLLNRLYSVLSQVSQAVVRATNPEAFLKETCRVIAAEGGFLLSRVGRIDPETGAVVPVASFGEACEYARGITVYADDRPEGRGPTGTSIRERRPVVYNDFLHDPLAQPWSQRAGAFGIKAVAAFPIESEGRVWGALTIYSNEIGFFGDKDMKLLEKVAIHIGFALDNLERERRRREAEDALLQSEERYRTLFEDAVLGIFRSTPEGKIIEVNPAYARMYGFESPEDVKVHINDVAVDLYADPSHRQAIVNRILASEGPIEAENQYLRNDGSIGACCISL